MDHPVEPRNPLHQHSSALMRQGYLFPLQPVNSKETLKGFRQWWRGYSQTIVMMLSDNYNQGARNPLADPCPTACGPPRSLPVAPLIADKRCYGEARGFRRAWIGYWPSFIGFSPRDRLASRPTPAHAGSRWARAGLPPGRVAQIASFLAVVAARRGRWISLQSDNRPFPARWRRFRRQWVRCPFCEDVRRLPATELLPKS